MSTSPGQAGSFDFVIVDVFTETAFGGNQLAVFPDATAMPADVMQKIAREFNFAESTFVVRAGSPKHAARIRIFTPKRELPFAGHPTVGTAAVLTHLGRLSFDAGRSVLFEEGIGDVSVEIGSASSKSVYTELVLSKGVEQPPTRPVLADLAASLSISVADVVDAWFAAVGVPFCFVRLASEAAVDSAVLDRQLWVSRIATTWAPQLFFFAGDMSPGGDIYARMFAPAFGIDEDPATGSAAVALIGVLAERLGDRDGVFSLAIRQGVAMGRPSSMKATAEKKDGEVSRLRVGGHSIIIAHGRMSSGNPP